MENFKISKNKDIVSLWGIQDWSGYPEEGWSDYCPTHDHNVSIVNSEGEIKYSIELERVTREKHARGLSRYIEKLNNLLPDDFIVVSTNHYAGVSFISENGLWRVESTPFGICKLITPTKAFVNKKEREAYICSHELAHIGTSLPFVGGFKDNSLLIHIDGLASESCFSVFEYKNKELRYIHHGWEPLLVIQLFGFNDLTCAMLGLNPDHRLATSGRLMGYSSYGSYSREIKNWLESNDWFKNYYDNPKEFFNKVKRFDKDIEKFDLKNKIFMDIAKVCQVEFEDTIFKLIKKYQKQTESEHLYFSGGSALNINLNTKIKNSGIFKSIFVPPCCSDTGLSLGAASIIHMLRGRRMKIHSPFNLNIGIENKKVPQLSKKTLENIVERLNNCQIMGVCIGYSENGPRALGHRSILAVPTSKEMYKRVSTQIKGREWYRPVAPIIIEDLAEEVFPGSTKTELSRYMLGNFEINDNWIEKIPAVVHTDKTARVQVIYKNDTELKPIYEILKTLWEKYKIPCLINTSFNGSGEPIVHTSEDAIKTAKEIGLDFVLLDDQVIELSGHE